MIITAWITWHGPAKHTYHELSLFGGRIFSKGLMGPTFTGFVTTRFFFYGTTLKVAPTAVTHTIWMD
jgi:hypothetical protein